MFPLPALVTRVPRPARAECSAAAGDCLHNFGTIFDTPPSCMSRKRRAWSGPSNNPKNVGMPLLRHPPPPIGYEIAGNPRISSLKAI